MDTTQKDYQDYNSQCTFTIQPTTGKTNTIHLKVEEDVPAELEAFVRLSHFELFDKAREWFDGCLRDHLAEFPVALEYADMLLRVGSYQEVQALSPPNTVGLPERGDIEQLWRLIRSLAHAHFLPWDSHASWVAVAFFHYLCRRGVGQDAPPSPLETYMLEVYLEIVVFDFMTSGFLHNDDQYKNPPWCGSDLPAWSSFGYWYADLRERGHYWEAHRILSILLPVLPLKDATAMFMRPNHFGFVVKNIDAGLFDETLIVSDLISANNICNYILHHCYGLLSVLSDEQRPEGLVELAGAYLQNSRSLAAILCCLSKADNDEKFPAVLEVETLEEKLEPFKKGPCFVRHIFLKSYQVWALLPKRVLGWLQLLP